MLYVSVCLSGPAENSEEDLNLLEANAQQVSSVKLLLHYIL